MNELDTRILDFEEQWWKYAGSKEAAIDSEFGLSATRYYQHLTRIIDNPAAEARNPMLVRRLRRLADSRGKARRARQGL